jgi:hypothetical protein
MDQAKGSSSSKKPTTSQCFVKNICILDVETGLIVFQKVYKWKESSAFSNLGGLIQSFYQFAREVDDGLISCVNFESGRKVTTRLLNPQDTYQQAASRNQTMQMKSVKTADVIVSVFFDMQGMEMPSPQEDLKLDVLMHAVLEAFARDFLHELLERRPTLQQFIDQQSAAAEESDARVTLPFDAFGAVADKLRRQLFPLQDAVGSSGEDIVLNEALSVDDHVHIQITNLRSDAF